VDSRTVIKRLRGAGWRPISQAGSHLHFEHDERPGKVTVPHPRKDIKIKTLQSIERQSGVKLRRPE
jgi:predicted RNA binding protein YcfA (HicA-like mRNA interferase family)